MRIWQWLNPLLVKKMEGFDKLKNLLSKNLGYIGKFTEYLMNENIPFLI